ncbi:MAG: pro-sigmaK processing inhibitor BofA family protein [Clostridia bacterium]|nr:pro-sigmaK processing inhibitor BofA family protein [Clostridia bacterium]
MIEYAFYIGGVICAIALIIFSFRGRRPFRTMLITALFGLLALTIVCVSGIFTGVTLPINIWTVSCSALGGVPGVITLLILKMIFV